MNPNEAKTKDNNNINVISQESNDQKNEDLKNKKVNHCLPSFLTDDYFNNSSSNDEDEEELNEEKNYENKKDNNSTQDDSNKILNYPQNNFIYSNNNNLNINNNISQFNQNYIDTKKSMMNQNNNIIHNNYNMNYFHNNGNNINYQQFYSINNNNYVNSINSYNNIIQRNWNSFSGLAPINSYNFLNNNPNNFILPLSFSNDYNHNNNNTNFKCLSFSQGQIQPNGNNNPSNNTIKKPNNIPQEEKPNKSNSNISLKKLLEMNEQNLYNYIITQKGSRDVQNILKKANENEVELIIAKIKKYFSDITIDKYGNYFSKKLIQICLPSQRVQLLESINNRFVEIANNSFGTHPLQCLIEIINMPEEKKLVLNYILNNEKELALDSKGTHVLQKFISCTKDEERNELNQNLIKLIDQLIINQFGVCALIQLVKHSKDKNIAKKLANYITSGDPLSFIQHPYANYAVQSLLINTDLTFCDVIIDTIIQNYLSLSMQKFSSNVVENCIKYGKESTVKKIYKNIVEQEKLESLLNNNYGNFVLEKLIARLNKEERMVFIKKIDKLGKTKVVSNTIKSLLYK